MTNKTTTEILQNNLKKLQTENLQLREQLAGMEAEFKFSRYLSEEHLKALKIMGIALDLNYYPVYCTGAVKEITGYEKEDFMEEKVIFEQLVHPEDLTAYRSIIKTLLDTLQPQTLEFRIISGEGQLRWLNTMIVPVQNGSGKVVNIQGIILDITGRKKMEEELLDRQAHLDSILSSVQDVIWSVTPDTFELLYINPAAEQVYGCPLEEIYQDAANGYKLFKTSYELILENFSTLLQRGWFEVEYIFHLPNGEKRWLNRRAHFAHDAHGFVARIDGIDTDITRRKKAEDALRYISMHDHLTGLYNRFYFEKEMHAAESDSVEAVGLIVCDVDGLKTINDNLGHEAGDQLLIQCSDVLKRSSQPQEIVSRIGGDEFTVLIKDCSIEYLESYVKQLRQAIGEYNQTEAKYPLSLSIGYALKASPDMSMREVFRQADNLMYAQKPENRQSFHKLYRTLKL